MNIRDGVRQHLGEREFLDYPLFLEASLVERSVVLQRALLGALGVAVVTVVALLMLG